MYSFILSLSRNRVFRLFYYEGNIVLNLQGRYDGITRKPTFECTIAAGDFLIAVAIGFFDKSGEKLYGSGMYTIYFPKVF